METEKIISIPNTNNNSSVDKPVQFIKPPLMKKELQQDDSDSFDADDNENELVSGDHKKMLSQNIKQFELEMHNQGLLESIKQIQRLNHHLGMEFGVDGKKLSRDGSYNSFVNKKTYAFPFQKRVRSKSPLRIDLKNEIVCSDKKPLAITKNFVIGKAKKMDLCGLSTGPTDEEKKDTTKDDWMYQRIADLNIGGAIDKNLIKDEKVENKESFLELLNTMQFDK